MGFIIVVSWTTCRRFINLLVPLIIIPLGLFAVNQHAEPVDDCPCFEDAIAFVSVILGTVLARWHGFNWGLDENANFFQSKTPGWEGRDLGDWSLWLSFAALKLVVGMWYAITEWSAGC